MVRPSRFTKDRCVRVPVAKRLNIPEKEAFANRHANRQMWFEIGNELRAEFGPTYLAEQVARDCDFLIGIRNREELQRARVRPREHRNLDRARRAVRSDLGIFSGAVRRDNSEPRESRRVTRAAEAIRESVEVKGARTDSIAQVSFHDPRVRGGCLCFKIGLIFF